jgi:P4 family phage/plasmid primase-like protien
MRLPGTVNSKHGDVRVVKVEKLDADRRYDFDELEEAVAGWRPLLTVKEAPAKAAMDKTTPRKRRVSSIAVDNPFLAVAEAQGWKPPLDVEQALASMTYPGNVHDTQIRVAASLAKAGVDRADAVRTILDATKAVVGTAGWDWNAEEKAIGAAYDSAVAKFDIPEIRPITSNAAVSHETPQSPVTVAVKGATIGAKKRKQPNAQATHIVLARTVLEVLENDGYRLLFTERGSYVYEAGVWTKRDKDDFNGWLNAALEEGAQGLGLESTGRLINEARTYIIRQPGLQGRGTVFDRHGKVPTLSGLIDPVTGELEPINPDHFCTWRIPFEYDPAATCPHWQQVLADVFADRTEAVQREHFQLVQEILGAGLIDAREKGLRQALVLVGGSDYGKSVLLDVLGGLFGPDINTTSLERLEKDHGTQSFARRIPWVLHEAFNQNQWHVSSTVKAIISGNGIDINPKGGTPFSHNCSAPVFWGANNPPQFKESTDAMINRMIIVECKRKFDRNNPVGVAALARAAKLDGPAALVLATEMPGVMAWALEGLRRVLARGHYIIPDESRAAAEAVKEGSNLVAGFMNCVTFDPYKMVSIADFTAAVAAWWKEYKGNHGTPSNDSVGKALRALADPRIGLDLAFRDKHRRYIAGVKLNDEGKRYWGHTVNSNAFDDHARKASTSLPDEDPNIPIPASWEGRGSLQAMRAAQAKRVTRGPVTDGNGFPGDTSPDDTGDTVDEVGDTY